MAIREISGTESTRGSVTIVEVEVSEPDTTLRGRLYQQPYTIDAWEASCAACEMLCTNLTESEALEELETHRCPEIPPCEREEAGACR